MIRRFEEGDFSDIFVMESDEEVMKHTGPGRAQSDIEIRTRFDRILANIAQDPLGYWAYVIDDEVVGWLMLVENEDFPNEIGYMVKRCHWGKGHAKKMIALLLEKFDETHRNSKIFARINEENQASRRVVETNGFTPVDRVICERTGKKLVHYVRTN